MNAEYSSKVIYNESGIPYLVNVTLVPLTEKGITINESILEALSEEDLKFLNELNLLGPVRQVAGKAKKLGNAVGNKLSSKKGGIGTKSSNATPTDGQPANTTAGSNGQPADSTPPTGSGNDSKEKEVKQPTESNGEKATGTKPGETDSKDSGGDPSSSATDNSNDTKQQQQNSNPAPASQPKPDSAGTTTPSNTQPQGRANANASVGTVDVNSQNQQLDTSKPKGISTGTKVAGAAAVGMAAGAIAAKKIMNRRKKKSRYNDD